MYFCGRRRYRDRHLVYRASEFVIAFLVVFGHRRAEILADILGFVPQKDKRMSALDSALGDLLIVHVERARAALADPAAVIVEVEFHRDLPGRQRVF